MRREQKIAWLWNEFNGIFLDGMDEGYVLGFDTVTKAEHDTWSTFGISEPPHKREIEKVLKMKINASNSTNTEFILEDVNPYLHLAPRLGYILQGKELEVVT